MMSRQSSARQVSLADSVHKMAGSLTRSLSFKNKGYTSANRCGDEVNVFASDMVSRDFILESLKNVKHNQEVIKVEVEDLLIAQNHNSFLPVIKGLLTADQRRWKSLRFTDTIASTDFLWWQGMKHCLMREYEESIDDKDLYKRVVSFNANIQVVAGSSKRAINALLKDILRDKDVVNVSFSGALFGYHDVSLPSALMGIMDESSGLSKQSFVVSVKCGWRDLAEEHEHNWKRLLKSLARILRYVGRARSNSYEDNDDGSVSMHSALSMTGGGDSIPRRHRRNSNELPVVKSEHSRRSLTLPHAGQAKGANRALPRRTKSLHTKSQNKASSDESSERRPLPRSRKTPARAKSFEPFRPERGILGAFLEDENGSADATPRAPIRKGSGHNTVPAIRRTSSSSSSKSSRSPKHLRRTKSHSHKSGGGSSRNLPDAPDYDWSTGHFTPTDESKRIVCRAA